MMDMQPLKSKHLAVLEEKIHQGNTHAVQEFFQYLEEKGTPLVEEIEGDIENNLITFVYKADEEIENVLVFSALEWDDLQVCKLERLLDTNIWFKTFKARNDIHLRYNFSINDALDEDWDKRAKNVTYDRLSKNKLVSKENSEDIISYVSMKNAKKTYWIKERQDIPKGKLKEYDFHSENLEEDRKVRVYTPYGYEENNIPYGYLVLTDGNDYINFLSTVTALDNLIAEKKIPPIVGIFIDSTEKRLEELKCNDIYTEVIVKEIIPWIRAKYNVSQSASEAVIGGFSLGGLTASYFGLKYPEVFGNILSQSGSYWYAPEGEEELTWLAKQYEVIDKLPLKFYLNIGVLEHKERMIDTNRKFRDVLIGKGYTVNYEEFGSGHDYLGWGETLADGLISLIGIK